MVGNFAEIAVEDLELVVLCKVGSRYRCLPAIEPTCGNSTSDSAAVEITSRVGHIDVRLEAGMLEGQCDTVLAKRR